MRIPLRFILSCSFAVAISLVLSACGNNNRELGMGTGGTMSSVTPDSSKETGPGKAAKTSGKKEDMSRLNEAIPICFNLQEPGYVTLVIDDVNGRRVRNLVSETPFPAGENMIWWDGLDEQMQQASDGSFSIAGRFVQPGKYSVHGIFRKNISLKYEMTPYNGGNPPWPTLGIAGQYTVNPYYGSGRLNKMPSGQATDCTGGWLGDHSPPAAVLALLDNRLLIGSEFVEAGDGLVWVDPSGRRLKGVRTLGANGGYGGAYLLARDAGSQPQSIYEAYLAVASVQDGHVEIWGVGKDSKKLFNKIFLDKPTASVEGLAVRDGLLVASLDKLGELLFCDAASGKELITAALSSTPQGLCFDKTGDLLVIAGNQIWKYNIPPSSKTMVLPKPQILVADGLDAPRRLALDEQGNIYVSDDGDSQQVKVFSPKGEFLRAIGVRGGAAAGPYDPMKMQHPLGISITPDGHLWVAEHSFSPKRISVWSLDGRLVNALYGPTRYGGGGNLDPCDSSRFYYADGEGGMEFQLDWKTGETKLSGIYYLTSKVEINIPGLPQMPIYFQKRQYMTNLFTENPVAGENIASLWIMRDGRAIPVAAFGQANAWKVLRKEPFTARWPEGAFTSQKNLNQYLFAWSDLNADGKVQPDEVSIAPGIAGGLTFAPDLSLVTSLADRFAPASITPAGVPIYDLNRKEQLFKGARSSNTSGGNQVLLTRDDWTIMTSPPEQAAACLAGAKDGQLRWTYPCESIGLHASQKAPMPKYPGYLIGTTRLLGLTVTPRGTKEELWAINGNHGVVYLFTTDGLFVSTLFQDIRQSEPWPATAARGIELNKVSLHDECFFPSINQAADGNIYLSVGMSWAAIVRIDGLESIIRLPESTITVTAEFLAAVMERQTKHTASGIDKKASEKLVIYRPEPPPLVDGKLDDWANASWVTIDDKVSASIAIAGDRLYAAYRTPDPNLLVNKPEAWQLLFKTGGALDLMLGTNPKADPARTLPLSGDLRLLVTLVNGKILAVVYRPVFPDKSPFTFTSPVRSISFDRVEDVSDKVELGRSDGNYELSIPLSVLGLAPKQSDIRGDIGILRGNGMQTTQRIYWHNKETGLISDVPGEAMLTPQMWGVLHF
ncbi:MAG: hypothetical protein WAX69_05690 [Victivallales bacterium]